MMSSTASFLYELEGEVEKDSSNENFLRRSTIFSRSGLVISNMSFPEYLLEKATRSTESGYADASDENRTGEQHEEVSFPVLLVRGLALLEGRYSVLMRDELLEHGLDGRLELSNLLGNPYPNLEVVVLLHLQASSSAIGFSYGASGIKFSYGFSTGGDHSSGWSSDMKSSLVISFSFIGSSFTPRACSLVAMSK